MFIDKFVCKDFILRRTIDYKGALYVFNPLNYIFFIQNFKKILMCSSTLMKSTLPLYEPLKFKFNDSNPIVVGLIKSQRC